MNWTNVKKSTDIELLGVTVEIDRCDSQINSITLVDAAGNKVRIANRSYTLQVEVPAKPKMVEKFMVVGEVSGLKVEETFDYQHEADGRKDELLSAVRSGTSTDLKVEPTQVPEEVFF